MSELFDNISMNGHSENELDESRCIALASLLDENGKQFRRLELIRSRINNESGKAMVLPVYDENDPKYKLTPERLAILEAEHKKAFEIYQQTLLIQDNQKTSSPSPLDPDLVKEMDELCELLYGTQ
jgi:hypothetical protein